MDEAMQGGGMDEGRRIYVYGSPSLELASPPQDAIQLSPLSLGAERLEDLEPGVADEIVIAAPSATLERRYVLASSLRALRSGGALLALAPKDKGGSRLRAELKALGCEVDETARRHHRICRTARPPTLIGVDEAITAGEPRLSQRLGLWTQPGLFAWNRPDPGTELLIRSLPDLAGAGADLGCGSGRLAKAVLAHPAVTRLDLFDIDRRAIDASRRNIDDHRAGFHWANVRAATAPLELDFVVMNPPFHEGAARTENQGLGQDFIRASRRMLHKGGALWMVANRHLPYEEVLAALFSSVEAKAGADGFKVLMARA